jgi:hypothetical protein
MNPSNGLAYKDQETAERVADELRGQLRQLLLDLTNMNEIIDSLALHNRIRDEFAKLLR